jgi:hypothetical protein
MDVGGRATQEQLPSASDVTISNYLTYGRKIAALRNDACFPAYSEVSWNLALLHSGMHFRALSRRALPPIGLSVTTH